ncbi:AAA family ATPase [Micromonospora sp. CB01531]|uniref:AAA family ATPase n=1 Tax=Micromonospora sp. CB01531 TaxID=1718947 RepID=UPI00093FBDF8|nr:ATP-binding protein [Micromonospora sp. CB01531]
MLLRFEVSNHRSISAPVELSMIAVDEDRPAARPFELLTEQVLTVAGIYGPNASGKSNVLDALAWISEAVGTSLRGWDEFIPREPFKFGDGPTLTSSFEVEMMVNGVRYTYSVVVDDSEVAFEGLSSYPERRRRSLFERDGMDLHFRRGLGGLSGGTRELLTPTTLALSAAMRFEDPDVRSFGRALANIGVLGVRRRPRSRRYFGSSFNHIRRYSTERMFFDSVDPNQLPLFSEPEVDRLGSRESALALLRFADLGIDDVQVVEEGIAEAAGTSVASMPETRRYLRLIHRAADQHMPFDLVEESEGTQTWFRLIGPTVRALRTGQTLLFDEIDASLHPKLSARLLELFQDPETNPRGAQLIFTTHDTSLLNHLNRDEVWLTEKDSDGSTSLTALAEYGGDKVRRSLNLEKAYLQGRFGAVPEFDQHILRRALGLLPEER